MKPKQQIKCLLLALFTSTCLISQDVHFSQFMMAPLQLNPALTAASDWDVRMGANWRQQWVQVPVNYQTFGAFYDQKMSVKILPKGYWGLGGNLIHDQAGDGRLSWTQLGLRAAYHYPIGDEQFLSIGVSVDAGQRAFRAGQLQFSDQYNGELFDPSQASSEQFAQTSASYISPSAGLNYQWKDGRSRTMIQAGFAATHLNRPTIAFFDGSNLELSVLKKAYIDVIYEMTEEWDVKGQVFWAQQGPYQELVFGGGGRYHLDWKGKVLMIGSSLFYRWGDAFILQLEGGYEQWRWGISYDVNTSAFNTATQGRGGLELALHYYLLKAKPPEEFKSCPIF